MAVAAAGLVLTGIGAGVEFVAGRKQAKASRKQGRLQELADKAQAQRERRQAIRQARIARGAQANVASQTGASGSSAELGGAASIRSQLDSNIGFSNQLERVGRGITNLELKKSRLGTIGAIGQGLQGLGAGIHQFGS